MPPDTPVFDTEGNVRILPDDQVPAALSSGGRLAIKVKDDKGEMRYVPHDQLDAVKENGGSAVEAPGFFGRFLRGAGLPATAEEWKTFLPHSDTAHVGLPEHAGTLLEGTLRPKQSEVPGAQQTSLHEQELPVVGGMFRAAAELNQRKEHPAMAHMLSAVPGVGPAAYESGIDFEKGNYAGMLGDWANIATQLWGAKNVLKKPVSNVEAAEMTANRVTPNTPAPVINPQVAPKVLQTAKILAKPPVKMAVEAAKDIPVIRGIVRGVEASKDIPEQLRNIWSSPEPALTAQNASRTPIWAGKGIEAGQPPIIQPEPMQPLPLHQRPEPVTPTAERVPAEVGAPQSPAGRYIPSGEMSLNRVLTSLDQKTLLRVAKSRGIDVTAEAQLRPGVAITRIIKKIGDDFSPEELDSFGQQAQEVFGHKPVQGDLTPQQGKDLWTYKMLKTFFPDVSMPAALEARARFAMAKRPGSSAASSTAAPVSAGAKTAAAPAAKAATEDVTGATDLTGVLQRSIDKVKAEAAPQGGHAGGGVTSIEEVNRPGSNYTIPKSGFPTAQGKSFDPGSTPAGGSHVTVVKKWPPGLGEYSLGGGYVYKVNAGQQLTPGQVMKLRSAVLDK